MPAFANRRSAFVARRVGALLSLFLAACSSEGTAPDPLAARAKNPRRPVRSDATVPSPAFLFVSNTTGAPQIYRFRGDTITRLSFSEMPDVNPHVSGTRVVFASYREGSGDIYTADLELSSVRRLTFSGSTEDEPAFNATGDRIAFTSNRSGATRIFVMDSSGAGERALVTGSSDNVPETRPSWSPAGDRIAFASSRTGTSQIFVVDTAGGEARQLTHESIGAFDPVFTADGTQIIYTAWLTSGRLRVVTLATGEVSDYSADNAESVGEGDCSVEGCIVTTNPYTDAGDIAYVARDGSRRTLITRVGNDFRPSRLVR